MSSSPFPRSRPSRTRAAVRAAAHRAGGGRRCSTEHPRTPVVHSRPRVRRRGSAVGERHLARARHGGTAGCVVIDPGSPSVAPPPDSAAAGTLLAGRLFHPPRSRSRVLTTRPHATCAALRPGRERDNVHEHCDDVLRVARAGVQRVRPHRRRCRLRCAGGTGPGVGHDRRDRRPDRAPDRAVIAVVSMAGSLYLSEVAHFLPCRLCWYQRIGMYPLAVILVIAAIRRDTRVWPYPFDARAARVADLDLPRAARALPVARNRRVRSQQPLFDRVGRATSASSRSRTWPPPGSPRSPSRWCSPPAGRQRSNTMSNRKRIDERAPPAAAPTQAVYGAIVGVIAIAADRRDRDPNATRARRRVTADATRHGHRHAAARRSRTREPIPRSAERSRRSREELRRHSRSRSRTTASRR